MQEECSALTVDFHSQCGNPRLHDQRPYLEQVTSVGSIKSEEHSIGMAHRLITGPLFLHIALAYFKINMILGLA